MKTVRETGNSTAWQIRHRIGIPALTHEADALTIENGLGNLPGILQVECDLGRKKICVQYDQTRVDFLALANRLEEIGFPGDDGWWSRWKARWFQYLDTNARENAVAPVPPCCSDPKGISSSIKRKG